jgi:electron transfer flavoprotein alpha subunit
MKIIVCIKQVPVVSAMKFDPETKTLKREGVPSEVSSFDIRALLKAVELRGTHGGEVTVITMGPPQAKAALEHCLALGADRAIHMVDRAFAGSDTLATARALALAIKREAFDLILCGRHSTDAETGQVGPELAEFLGLPQVTAARKITVEAGPSTGKITVERETDLGFETVECSLPVLLSATEDLAPERFPAKADREKAKEKPIQEVTASDLSADLSLFGSSGSPTWVAAIETVEVPREKRVIAGESLPGQVNQLVEALLERGLFGQWTEEDREGRQRQKSSVADGKSIWVVAEILSGSVRPVSLELLGKAVDLAERTGGQVTALVMGSELDRYVQTLGRYGADTVYLADDPCLEPYTTDAHAAVLAQAVQNLHPSIVLIPSTVNGRDLAPRVAARLELGLTGDCIDLDLDSQGRLLQYKPAFGGNVVAPILSRTFPEMATLRPGMLKKLLPDPSRQARVEKIPVNGLAEARVRVISQTGEEAARAAALDAADIVVGVGKGVGGPANLAVAEKLAEVLGAPLATTRDVADLGWLPRQHQVGLTGRAIAPKLYLAIAIRGAFEHLVGIRRAGIVVAINKNPKAPIFQAADLGIVGDYAEVVPLLTAALAAAKERRSGKQSS